MANDNKGFLNAAKAKKDEFYTQLTDIEKEMHYYRDAFHGKTVLCNCDDPYESNFFKYFAMNFNALGLKKLIATCYATSPFVYTQFTLSGEEEFFARENEFRTARPYKVEITKVGDETGDGRIGLADVAYLMRNRNNVLTLLEGDGDFRSPECVELLKEADIVVTNPPFSLFREYVAQLIKYGKQFIIIGNQNAISYKEIFPLLQNNKMWLGHHCGDMSFVVPQYYEERSTRYWVDKDGQKWRSMGNICWYTNIDVKTRHELLVLYKHYAPEEYPEYANYDAIEVSKVSEIPCDYYGKMGVPITFLQKYNPDQFEILGSSRWLGRPMSEIAEKGSYVSGGVRFYLPVSNESTPPPRQHSEQQLKYRCLYDRIVIRRKVPEIV